MVGVCGAWASRGTRRVLSSEEVGTAKRLGSRPLTVNAVKMVSLPAFGPDANVHGRLGGWWLYDPASALRFPLPSTLPSCQPAFPILCMHLSFFQTLNPDPFQVRKSFDARKAKPKMWAYVVDVDAAAATKAGAAGLEPKQGQLEW